MYIWWYVYSPIETNSNWSQTWWRFWALGCTSSSTICMSTSTSIWHLLHALWTGSSVIGLRLGLLGHSKLLDLPCKSFFGFLQTFRFELLDLCIEALNTIVAAGCNMITLAVNCTLHPITPKRIHSLTGPLSWSSIGIKNPRLHSMPVRLPIFGRSQTIMPSWTTCNPAIKVSRTFPFCTTRTMQSSWRCKKQLTSSGVRNNSMSGSRIVSPKKRTK